MSGAGTALEWQVIGSHERPTNSIASTTKAQGKQATKCKTIAGNLSSLPADLRRRVERHEPTDRRVIKRTGKGRSDSYSEHSPGLRFLAARIRVPVISNDASAGIQAGRTSSMRH